MTGGRIVPADAASGKDLMQYQHSSCHAQPDRVECAFPHGRAAFRSVLVTGSSWRGLGRGDHRSRADPAAPYRAAARSTICRISWSGPSCGRRRVMRELQALAGSERQVVDGVDARAAPGAGVDRAESDSRVPQRRPLQPRSSAAAKLKAALQAVGRAAPVAARELTRAPLRSAPLRPLLSSCVLVPRMWSGARVIPLSVLDLAPIVQGGDAARAFRQLARSRTATSSAWGYRRFWLAEHHGMPGIASAATSIVIAHVAAGTSRIRVGAGGIMLPNHSPLVVAEQFGTLESLYPGRIDLALGRAPGTDPLTARALRRHHAGDAAEAFPQDVLEVMHYSSRGRRAAATLKGSATRWRAQPCARCRAKGCACRCGFSGRACSARRSQRRSACRTRSRRTSRRRS